MEKPLFKKDIVSDNKLESLLNSSNDLERDGKNNISKIKKNIEILENNYSENCDKGSMNNYPIFYQFLEKFNDKILGAVMKYENI